MFAHPIERYLLFLRFEQDSVPIFLVSISFLGTTFSHSFLRVFTISECALRLVPACGSSRSYHRCYPGIALIWHRELVGEGIRPSKVDWGLMFRFLTFGGSIFTLDSVGTAAPLPTTFMWVACE